MSESTSSTLLEIIDVTVAGLVSELEEKGVARIDHLLDALQTQRLVTIINQQLALGKSVVEDLSLENEYFAKSKSQPNRWDLKLPIDATLFDTMKVLLREGSLLGDTLESIAGKHARIHELAAFVTIQGAKRQIIHSDVSWSVSPSLFTCTIAMQDIDLQMGPTVFIPKTHTEEAQLVRMEEFMEDDINQKDSKLLHLPHLHSCLSAGSGAIYDSRLLHCGGANRSVPCKSRVLFYFTVATQLVDEDAANNELFDPEGILSTDAYLNAQKIQGASLRTENQGILLSNFR